MMDNILRSTGAGIDVPTIGDLFHITKTTISVGDDIPNSWVMFNWDIYQPLGKNG